MGLSEIKAENSYQCIMAEADDMMSIIRGGYCESADETSACSVTAGERSASAVSADPVSVRPKNNQTRTSFRVTWLGQL